MEQTSGSQAWRTSYLDRSRLPLIVAPMYNISTPDMVISCCRAGAIGSFPHLNAPDTPTFSQWMAQIGNALASDDGGWAAPYAVNLIVHPTNPRIVEDLEAVAHARPPIVITSVGRPDSVLDVVHGYGGLVLSDVSSLHHARRAADAGVDGLVLLCAGAGGQTGRLNPFAFTAAVRAFFGGVVVIAGGLTEGRQLRAVQAMDGDLGYMGTRFITARESACGNELRDAILAADIDDVWDTDAITGIPTNVLRGSLTAMNLTPDSRWRQVERKPYRWGSGGGGVAVHSSGHGVGSVTSIQGCRDIIDAITKDYWLSA